MGRDESLVGKERKMRMTKTFYQATKPTFSEGFFSTNDIRYGTDCSFVFQTAADYSAYAYNQSAYSPYNYYQYMQSANSLCATPTTVPSTQTYQLLPPSSTTGTASNGSYNSLFISLSCICSFGNAIWARHQILFGKEIWTFCWIGLH